MFDPFKRAFKAMMRVHIARERKTRLARIKTIKGMLRGVETALARPDSKAAVLKLKAVRKQLTQDLHDEAAKLAERIASSRRAIASFGRTHPN